MRSFSVAKGDKQTQMTPGVSGWVSMLGCACLLITTQSWAQDADPTQPMVRESARESSRVRTPQLRLTSIWYRNGLSSAHINGQRYQLGDDVGRFQLVDIEPNRVRLIDGDDEIWLSVFRSEAVTHMIERPQQGEQPDA
jgi:hypothetical protein